MGSTAIGIVGLGVQVVGAVGQYSAGKEAKKARKRQAADEQKALQLRQKQEEIAYKRRQKEIYRETLRQRARITQQAHNLGIGKGSSIIEGALGQATSQGGSALGTLNQDFAFAKGVGAFRTQANLYGKVSAEAQSKGSTFQGISSLGGSIFSSVSDIQSTFEGVF